MANYLNPPLVEVVLEVFYSTNKPWDVSLPGAFFKKVSDNFPLIGTKPHGLEFSLGPAGTIQKHADITVTQYYNKDRDALLQLAPGMFCVNKLAPFSDCEWSDLWTLFAKNFRAVNSLVKPDRIDKVGLRYINRIDIGEKHEYSILKEYVNYYPLIPDALPQSANSINMFTEIKYRKERDILAIRLATLVADENIKAPILLEISYNMVIPGGVNEKNINSWFTTARDTCRVAFESMITDKARAKFNNKI